MYSRLAYEDEYSSPLISNTSSPVKHSGDHTNFMGLFEKLQFAWKEEEYSEESFSSTTSLLQLRVKKRRKKLTIMACVGTLYDRLKRIFSKGEKTKAITTFCCSKIKMQREKKATESKKKKLLMINVNKFAHPMGENPKVNVSNKRIKKNRAGTRRILNFNSMESKSSSLSAAQSLSVSVSVETFTTPLTTRYEREFQEIELIGKGAFGSVYRCINRLDGCVYAVKRSKPLIRNSYAQKRAINEVHANAALQGPNAHVVRYYSAWMDTDCMSIQQEFCNGGDLSVAIDVMRKEDKWFDEPALRQLLYHIANGLQYIHGLKLAHMDIKPENIFIVKRRVANTTAKCEYDNNSANDEYTEEIVYKIGDLGHTTSIVNTVELEDEGDCRYLSKEILREDYRDLTKADVFALGLTVYEAGGGGPLPKNGPAWHDIRDGNLLRLLRYSNHLNHLIKMMIHPEPHIRPSASDLVQDQFLTINVNSSNNK